MTVTEKDILNLKKKIEEGKNKLISSEATMKEISRSIEEKNAELEKLGVHPEDVEDFLDSKREDIEDKYNAILEKLED